MFRLIPKFAFALVSLTPVMAHANASDIVYCSGFLKLSDAEKGQVVTPLGFYLLGVRDERQAKCVSPKATMPGSDARVNYDCIAEATAQSAMDATSAAKIQRIEQFCGRDQSAKLIQAFYALSVFGTSNDDLWQR